MHLALLGDSTLDNGTYTSGGPAVIDHLSRLLPEEDRATLLALDGATTHGIENQLDRMPEGATEAVLSIGGNDAVMEIPVLEEPVGHVSEALTELSRAVERFEDAYRRCLKEVLQAGLPTTVCTIYNGAFEVNGQQQVIDAALAMWNDVILQTALDHECPVIDLRRVCTSRDDYTQQIEPSEQGGRKIAKALFLAALEPEAFSTRIGPTGT
jgi:hypothetical protein